MVNWDFLIEMLSSRGFGNKWISWVMSTIQNCSFCVRLNDHNGSLFVSGKGLKQVDPLYPILFNLVADVFSKMLQKAALKNIISRVLPHVVSGGSSACSMLMIPCCSWIQVWIMLEKLNGFYLALKACLG